MVAPLVVAGLIGLAGGVSVVGGLVTSYYGSVASTTGGYQTSLQPRPEYSGRSYTQEASMQYGMGYTSGAGAGMVQNAYDVAQAQRMAYTEQQPYYIDTAIQKAVAVEYAQRQAEYYASIQYPMEYGQAVMSRPQYSIMPYKIRIK